MLSRIVVAVHFTGRTSFLLRSIKPMKS